MRLSQPKGSRGQQKKDGIVAVFTVYDFPIEKSPGAVM
jgi:hypothetical protein